MGIEEREVERDTRTARQLLFSCSRVDEVKEGILRRDDYAGVAENESILATSGHVAKGNFPL